MWKFYRYPINFWRRLGPGLITGAADDDPSGIATYSQAGAQFGFNLGWTMVLSYPLMAAIQEISARIGRTTSYGLAGNLRLFYPIALLRGMVFLLLVANIFNLSADLGAMGVALQLVVGGSNRLWCLMFGGACIALQIFTDYRRYIAILKWLTLSLFAYVVVVLIVDMPWSEVLRGMFVPHIEYNAAYLAVIVAVFGTTISPYLFFWQSTHEAEDVIANPEAQPLLLAPEQAKEEVKRIRFDTWIGMGFSNLIALFIILTTAATLHAHGITDIQSAGQAAEALRPLAGPLAFTVFSLGIIGTGLLAVPVLAASSAYAVGEALDWHIGLGRRPREARAFYGTLVSATLIGTLMNFTHIEPMKVLFWSAVLNGVIAVPLMFVMMHMATSARIMGEHTIPKYLKILGWAGTAVMTIIVIALFSTAV
ncbi:MAG: divalent metal cation transporter [Alphaproteobacteria bacterium]|nr:divalent metal cation transporter [Alphaproteobacteria bacterium]